MNAYQETIAERKAMASGARHKKNGSRSKRCSLPSDNLTPAQKRKLNGECRTYQTTIPLTWEEFKAMPTDLQKEHLDYVQGLTGAGINAISQVYFHMSDSALQWHCKANGIPAAPASRSRTQARTAREWMGEPTSDEEGESMSSAGEETPAAEQDGFRDEDGDTEGYGAVTLNSLSLSMEGTPDAVIRAIRGAMRGMEHVAVYVSVTNTKKEELK